MNIECACRASDGFYLYKDKKGIYYLWCKWCGGEIRFSKGTKIRRQVKKD